MGSDKQSTRDHEFSPLMRVKSCLYEELYCIKF